MEGPRHVLRTLFQDTPFPLVDHHLASFNAMIEKTIPTFIKVSNPFKLELVGAEKSSRLVRVYIGGKDGSKLSFLPPVDEHGGPIVPHACRLDNLTYQLTIKADIVFEYVYPEGEPEIKTFEDITIGEIPLMLRSKNCYLTAMDGYSIGECTYELGGYFIIDGKERVLLTQELLGNNMMYSGERNRKPISTENVDSELEGESKEEKFVQADKFESEKEVYVGIKSVSEDASKGPYSHFLVLGPPTGVPGNSTNVEEQRNQRSLAITLPGFQDPVPVMSIFAALGVTSDRDIYDTILAGVPDKDRLAYDDTIQQIILSHAFFLTKAKTTNLAVLEHLSKRKFRSEVIQNIYEMLFPHIQTSENPGILFRRKAYLLGQMVKMAIDLSLGRKPASDRDNIEFKRFNTSGDLMFQEFRRIYREVAQEMLLKLDSRVQYETKTYAGRNLSKLVERETVGTYWKKYRMINGFTKSFKGQWGGRDGIAQELSRLSYISYLSQLRRTSLQIDPDMNTAPPRRLYASQFGLMCPIDSPDGSGVGHLKALTILARVSTAFPSSVVREALFKLPGMRKIEDVHPSTWEPTWSRVYVNSDLVGLCIGDTEELHAKLMGLRRAGTLRYDVSLAWNRLENVYTITCDAGRPIRPVYHAGVTEQQVLRATTWEGLMKLMDYVDAMESGVSRFSMEPYNERMQSEIHMSFCISPMSNLVPFLDHNPGTRNNFATAQQKQACSWYHTNYNKRFDTIASITVNPQKPLSHTWMYREIMGAGGCMPYGENVLVAFTMYGGLNQEDSVIINKTSLKRGMFRTQYFHSYDVRESLLDPSVKPPVRTLIANPVTNAKYMETVKRKEDVTYEMLDADGIIKLNSIVDDKTVLVGIVTPITNAEGVETGFRDASELPKRGQHGRVDAIYRYSMSDGTNGVKIRIVEERSPVPGDKMASRHSQKGTVGQLMDEENMPFTAKGVRPDLIFNPHGMPTRMTIGQLLEAMSNKLGLELGTFVDATPFTTSKRVADLKTEMIMMGFEPRGHEMLYNGETGEMMEADIFMGPIYYQRLKHMVEDKINYRATGAKTLLTHQPLHGRAAGGGLAIGEMERDGMIAHGMSKFLHESFMDRSDGAEIQFDRATGRLDTSKDTLEMPYAMSLFVKELESCHVEMKLLTETKL
jgi:DNA-directed RNA polymerase II subunit RPB2